MSPRDPASRSTVSTSPATPERWEDVVTVMTGGGDGGTCWCRWFSLTSAQWTASTTADRRSALEDEIVAGPPRALIAYVDAVPAGWIRIAPRSEQGRITRSRIPRASPAPMRDPSVWAITCVQVRRGYRGLGIVDSLISGAIEFAREQGASSIEAYPIDTALVEVSNNDLFHGPASAFLAHGFIEVARPAPARPVLSLDLG